MALHWNPVGPQSAQTYWKRRAAVALAVLVPLVLLLSLLGGGDDDQLVDAGATAPASASAEPTATPVPVVDPSATPAPSVTAGTSASPSASASPTAAAVACTDAVLRVEAAAAEDTYTVGARPKLQLRVTNAGPTPCSRDLGQAAVELQVVSGADRIWSSDDCAPGGDADVVTLEPGQAEVSTVTWSGARSLPGCDGDEQKAEAGTYRVLGRVGELREQGASFVLR